MIILGSQSSVCMNVPNLSLLQHPLKTSHISIWSDPIQSIGKWKSVVISHTYDHLRIPTDRLTVTLSIYVHNSNTV